MTFLEGMRPDVLLWGSGLIQPEFSGVVLDDKVEGGGYVDGQECPPDMTYFLVGVGALPSKKKGGGGGAYVVELPSKKGGDFGGQVVCPPKNMNGFCGKCFPQKRSCVMKKFLVVGGLCFLYGMGKYFLRDVANGDMWESGLVGVLVTTAYLLGERKGRFG